MEYGDPVLLTSHILPRPIIAAVHIEEQALLTASQSVVKVVVERLHVHLMVVSINIGIIASTFCKRTWLGKVGKSHMV